LEVDNEGVGGDGLPSKGEFPLRNEPALDDGMNVWVPVVAERIVLYFDEGDTAVDSVLPETGPQEAAESVL
jgi:hypothetical protein